jgi:hypothetical protein
MYYTQLTEDQQKQLINATQSYSAMLSFRQVAAGYRGGMVWRQKSGTDYLVKTSPEGSQRGMGARSPETEALAEAFLRNKARAEENFKASKQRVEQEVRLNRALRVGRCPNLVIDILNRLDKAGLAKHLMVIGTHALYAYESGVGVTFSPAITETRDLDILWDSRKRLSLASNEDVKALGLLGILQQVDNSFTLMKDQTYTAVNKDGYMVDVVKRRPDSLLDDQEPQQLAPNQDDFFAAKIRNMDWLLSSPTYKQIVIGVNGKMAEMHAPDPRAFAMFKHWLSQQPERDATKKPRDQRQAEAVRSLVEEFMPHMPFSDLAGFPTALRHQTA